MYSEGPNLCLPCPNRLHTTLIPAYGIKSCKCKEGFKETKNNGCEGNEYYYYYYKQELVSFSVLTNDIVIFLSDVSSLST